MKHATRILPFALLLIILTALFCACDNGSSPNTSPVITDTNHVDTTHHDTTHQVDTTHVDTSHTDTTHHVDTTSHPTTPVVRNCKTDPVVFNEYIMDPSVLKVVAQIGSIGGGNTELVGRSYVFPKDGQDGIRLPLTAPADLQVVGATRYLPPGAPVGYIPDWSLLLDAGCGVTLELYHIKDVSDSIKAARGDTLISDYSGYQQLPHKVSVKAGTVFGWYIHGLNSVAWDLIVHNDSVTNHFANQARYVARNSSILHVVCPYDLFSAPKKAAYYNLLGSVTGTPIPGAGCGTVERDVVGTPMGQWFFDSAFAVLTSPPLLQKDGYYGDPLPIILGPDSTVMVGHIGATDDVRIERSSPAWKNPATITTSYCYQVYPTPTAPSGWLYLRMATTTKMDVAYNPTGSCPTTFPASGFKSYFR